MIGNENQRSHMAVIVHTKICSPTRSHTHTHTHTLSLSLSLSLFISLPCYFSFNALKCGRELMCCTTSTGERGGVIDSLLCPICYRKPA